MPTIHILRAPLPWRPSRLTECGRIAKEGEAVPVEHVVGGLIGSAFLLCETCKQMKSYQGGSSVHSTSPIEREMSWTRKNRQKDRFLNYELQALGELVRRYPEEFERMVAALQAEQTLQKGIG
jgi:hypothetical protein